MKRLPLFAALFALSLASISGLQALADSFTITKNNQRYTCTSDGPTDPSGTIDCVDMAYKGPFSKDRAIRLCTGASGIGPAQCALKAYSGPFNQDEAVGLCSRNGTVARAECALKAYQGPYSKEEALKLCSGSNAELLIRSFQLMESSPELQKNIQNIKLRQQAFPMIQ
jgi:hypothetical protein